MSVQEENPLARRHLDLSARFKAAWAFHQMILAMRRMSSGSSFVNQSEAFQDLFGRLKRFSQNLHGATSGRDEERHEELARIEVEVGQVCEELIAQDQEISPSELRRFFTQVRSLDDRILIEVVRFYLGIQQGQEWSRDRLDKIDFLLSRLAEKIAGPDLHIDRSRLDKVLTGLLISAGPVPVKEEDLESDVEFLQDLRSEVRWVKTFEELNQSRLVEGYRALKHEMGSRVFHPRILPLVVEVNNAFHRKVNELRGQEEARLMDDYKQVSQLQQSARPQATELQAELTLLQQRVERFREGAKSKDVRLSELTHLGDSLRDIAARLQARTPVSPEPGTLPFPRHDDAKNAGSLGPGLVPDFEVLQPQWDELLAALSGVDEEISEGRAVAEAAVSAYRLEAREILAFRRTTSRAAVDTSLEQFILAAASLRHWIGQEATELRGLLSQAPGATPQNTLRRAGEAARIADAYNKHFSHLTTQAIFEGELEEARDLLLLQARLERERSGLLILITRISKFAQTGVPDNLVTLA